MNKIAIPTLLLLLGLLGGALPCAADMESYDFSGPVSEQRYKDLVGELRCLVCQNESLLASQAELAGDLRKEVYELMASGKSDREVVDFLVARYGDFVLYNPPIRPATYALWIGPFILLLVSVLVLYRTISRRNADTGTQLSEAEHRRVAALLGESGGEKEPR